MNIKYRLVSSETFDEVVDLIVEYFFPREPICKCLKDLQEKKYPKLDLNQKRKERTVNFLKSSPMSIVAQDTSNNGKVVGAIISSLSPRYDKDGKRVAFYDMDLSTEDYIKSQYRNNIVLYCK